MAVVLITGCSSGLGLSTAVEFARRGDQVFATMRSARRADALRAAAVTSGVSIEVLELDVTDDDSVRHGVAHVLASAGQIDVLVNNAGVSHYGTVELMPWEWLRATFETNFSARKLEQLLHQFFAHANLQIDVVLGRHVQPKEWFVVPLDLVEETVKRILDRSIVHYRYDAVSRKILPR